jgi:uncharacterized membrane protein
MTLAVAIACALNAGVFFTFSSFVMPAVRALPPAQGIAAMQSINVKAITPVFMTALFGTALACIVVAAVEPGASTLAGAALYLVGTIGVTMAYNVPRNNALAVAGPYDHDLWRRYLREWTAANHVRTAAALAAAAVLVQA